MIEPGLIKFLDEQTQTRLRAFEKMFDSEGWKLTVEFMEYQYNMQKLNVLGATSWEDNRLATGKMAVLGDILRLEESTAAEFEGMALEAQEAAAQEVIDGELEYE
jgi:hypothetical protein